MSRGAAVAHGSSRNVAFLLIGIVAFVSAIGMLAAAPKKALGVEGGYWGYICVYNSATSYTQQWLNENNIVTGNGNDPKLKPWLDGSQPNNLATPTLIAAVQAYLDANGPHVTILSSWYTDPATAEDLTWTYNHDCNYPAPSPTPTPTATSTATATATASATATATATATANAGDTPPPLDGLDASGSTPPPTDLASQSNGGSNVGLGLLLLVLAGIMAGAGILLPKGAKR